jgi:hypothetical protein
VRAQSSSAGFRYKRSRGYNRYVTRAIITGVVLVISAGALHAQKAPATTEVHDNSRWMETSAVKENWKTIQTVAETTVGVTVRQTSIPIALVVNGITQAVSYRTFSVPFENLGKIEIRHDVSENRWIVVLHAAAKGFHLAWWPNSIGPVQPDRATEVQLGFADQRFAQEAFAYFLYHKATARPDCCHELLLEDDLHRQLQDTRVERAQGAQIVGAVGEGVRNRIERIPAVLDAVEVRAVGGIEGLAD